MGFFKSIINDAKPRTAMTRRSPVPETMTSVRESWHDDTVTENERPQSRNRAEIGVRAAQEEGVIPREVRQDVERESERKSDRESKESIDPLLTDSDGVIAESTSETLGEDIMFKASDVKVEGDARKQATAKSWNSTVSSERLVRSKQESQSISGSLEREEKLNDNLEVSDSKFNESIDQSKNVNPEKEGVESLRSLSQETGQRTPPGGRSLQADPLEWLASQATALSRVAPSHGPTQTTYSTSPESVSNDSLTPSSADSSVRMESRPHLDEPSQMALTMPTVGTNKRADQDAPRVRIGQVDVVVSAPVPTVESKTPKSIRRSGFASKNALRRF